MKEFRNIIVGIALCLSAAIVFAQQPGTTVTYQITPNTFNCANQGSTYINCDGIPFVTANDMPIGSMWLYTGRNVYTGEPYGWGFFFGPNPLAGNEFTITSSSFTPSYITYHAGGPWTLMPPYPCAGDCSTFIAEATGTTPNGVPYTATITVDFWYYRSGRAFNAVVTGGEVAVRYQ